MPKTNSFESKEDASYFSTGRILTQLGGIPEQIPQIQKKDISLGKDIGTGFTATVYSGQLTISEKSKSETINVAIKKVGMKKDKDEDKVKWQNFIETEIKILYELNTLPKSITPHFYGYSKEFIVEEMTQKYYLVMEHFPDGSLANWIDQWNDKKQIPEWSERCKVAKQVTGAVMKLHHRKGYTHQDLKAGNVLLRKDVQTGEITGVALCDLAFAKPLHAQLVEFKGSLEYMSPELLMLCFKINNGIDAEKSEIFSLAMLLWEIATFKLPFSDYNVPQHLLRLGPLFIDQWLIQERIRGAREKFPTNTPKYLSNLITWGWKPPGKRPTIAEMYGALIRQDERASERPYDLINELKQVQMNKLKQGLINELKHLQSGALACESEERVATEMTRRLRPR